MIDREDAREVAVQLREMRHALERESCYLLLSADETEKLWALLMLAQECAADWTEGKKDDRKTTELMGKYHDFSDILLATALDGDCGGGIPDLRGVLINRLFDSSHAYLMLCETTPPGQVPTVICESMRRLLQHAEVLAGPSWGFFLRPIGAQPSGSSERLTVGATEPVAVLKLKERFHVESEWADLVEPLGCLIAEYGRGALRRFAAFRLSISEAGKILEPIHHFAQFPLDWLEGNEARIEVLQENTQNFLMGHRAHNVLIWGPRGGGKSTLIRALIAKYLDQGLRAIEITPSNYEDLPAIFELVRGRRQRFVGVLDNISLDRGDRSLHLLSRILDGGLEQWPDNLVFYATSNYKNLVDREGDRPLGLGQMQMDEQQPNLINRSIRPEFYDPQQLQRLDEERALDDRFALKVFLDLPHKKQYQQMVVSYARRAGINTPEDELLASFEVWRMRHNHDLVGGRTVRDFILAIIPEYTRWLEE